MKNFLASLFGSSEPTFTNLDQARTLVATVKANAEKLGKMFVAASLEIGAMLTKGENALAEHINSALGAARLQAKGERDGELLAALGLKAVDGQATDATIKASIDANAKAAEELATLKARNNVIETQLIASGIKLVASDAKAGLTSADVKTAIDNRISMKAGELTAALGTKPIEAQVVVDPKAAAKPVDPKLTGIDALTAKLAARMTSARA